MGVLSDFQLPESGDPAILSLWDEAGYPPGPGEDFAQYRQRLEAKKKCIEKLDLQLAATGETTVFETLKVYEKERISPEILEEAAEVTSSLYGFSFQRFPGFFSFGKCGTFVGGLSDYRYRISAGCLFYPWKFPEKTAVFHLPPQGIDGA